MTRQHPDPAHRYDLQPDGSYVHTDLATGLQTRGLRLLGGIPDRHHPTRSTAPAHASAAELRSAALERRSVAVRTGRPVPQAAERSDLTAMRAEQRAARVLGGAA